MKRVIHIMLLWAVVLGLAGCAGAEYYNEGHAGTANDPYIIDTNADLVMLRDRVNAGTESPDKYYRLTDNLNISAITDWVSIGDSEARPFTGHFDGNEKSIHLNITRVNNYAGLFRHVNAAAGTYAIRNLTVSGSLIGGNTAGIVQILNSGSIENCHFTGTMNCYWSGWSRIGAGGIAVVMTNGIIRNCTVTGHIENNERRNNVGDYDRFGGIVAEMTGGSIENCRVEGTTIFTSNHATEHEFSYAGGIVAYANIASAESIKGCNFSGLIEGYQYVGGIVGYISGGTVQNNKVTATTNSTTSIMSHTLASGGIAGRIGETTILESCDVSSLVTVSGGENAEGIGGIVGIMNASTLRNNQSYASIEGDIVNMGGVVGKLDAASYTITNNRYSSAEHGIGNNAQGVSSEEGCIKVGASISITTTYLNNATVNSAYTATLATNSTSAVFWSLTNGTSLPEGLTLDRSSGTISGTPTNAGDYSFTVKASPTSGAPATKEFTLTVQAEGTTPNTPSNPEPSNPNTPSNPSTPSNNDAGDSDGGGGCNSGIVSMSLLLLVIMIIRKSTR